MQYPASQTDDTIEQATTINRPHGSHRMLYAGHFHTQPGYMTVRDHGTHRRGGPVVDAERGAAEECAPT